MQTCKSESYFPIYLNLKNKKVLLVGGGKIATDKLQKLLDFTTDIKIIAKDFSLEILSLIKEYGLEFEKREYHDGDIDGFEIVVVAVDSLRVQKEIFLESRQKRVFVNSVDSKEYCDFIFGSYIKEDELVISISTSGTSPSVAKYLKRFLKKALPKDLSSFLRKVKQIRDTMPKGAKRMKVLDEECQEYFKSL